MSVLSNAGACLISQELQESVDASLKELYSCEESPYYVIHGVAHSRMSPEGMTRAPMVRQTIYENEAQ